MSGPPPKRDAERRRRNKKAVETTTVDLAELASQPVDVPVAPEEWHPIASQWFDSLARSGQAVFYEPSDWATALMLGEALSRELNPQPLVIQGIEGATVEMHELPIKGASLNAILKGMTALMVTEGDRRRLSIELERKRDREAALPEGVASIAQGRRERLAKAARA